jgi:hypothetical protein
MRQEGGNLLMPPHPDMLWSFLPWGYLLTVSVEIPVLVWGLSARHALSRRLAAGLWLTACTYPVVVLALPYLVWEPYGRPAYLAVAETFAPVAECVLFRLAYGTGQPLRVPSTFRDLAAIVAANLASFAVGEVLFGWL